jgi:hypothetical protein
MAMNGVKLMINATCVLTMTKTTKMTKTNKVATDANDAIAVVGVTETTCLV